MAHIKHVNTETYTVVIDEDNLLENHPAVINHPDLYEISEGEIPENAQYLNYSE